MQTRSLRASVLVASLVACSPRVLTPVVGVQDAATPAEDLPAVDRAAPPADDGKNTTPDAVFVDVPVVVEPDAPAVDAPAPDATAPMDAPTVADATTDAGPADRLGVRDGGPLPNLIPVISNPQIQERTFAAGSCEVMEGCTSAGDRRLLRFDLTTPNVGAGDLYLGPPTVAGRPLAAFEYGTCHMHWHLRGYADYRLVTMDGREVARGHKQSFCLLDSGRYMGMGVDVPAAERFGCGNQGIHAGWDDVYGRGLDCQYVDITGVPPGRYRIRAQINIERVLAESSYVDNESFYTIDVPPPPDSDAGAPDGGASVDPTLACPSDMQGLTRDCGWQVEGPTRTCTPRSTVNVGCNQGCVPPIGVCAGDPMLRICSGGTPCQDLTAVASNDDSCAGDGGPTHLCASLSFTCPASGRYTIMTSPYRSGSAYECHLDVR